jgi:hypothetical protein
VLTLVVVLLLLLLLLLLLPACGGGVLCEKSELLWLVTHSPWPEQLASLEHAAWYCSPQSKPSQPLSQMHLCLGGTSSSSISSQAEGEVDCACEAACVAHWPYG